MSGDVSFFAVGTVGLSSTNGHKPCTRHKAARHNLREIQAELGADSHIDAARTRHNIIVAGPPTADEVEAIALQMLSSIVGLRLKRDHVQCIELVFSAPTGFSGSDEYLRRCVHWAEQALGLPVLSAVIHNDENSPHCHVLMLPVRDGGHVGSRPIAKAELARLRASFFSAIAGPAGLQRGQAKMRGASKRAGIAQVLQAAQAMGLPAAAGSLWPVIAGQIERDPTPFVRALGVDVRPTKTSPIELCVNLPVGGSENQALSCVGLALLTTPKPAPSVAPTSATASPAGSVSGAVLGTSLATLHHRHDRHPWASTPRLMHRAQPWRHAARVAT